MFLFAATVSIIFFFFFFFFFFLCVCVFLYFSFFYWGDFIDWIFLCSTGGWVKEREGDHHNPPVPTRTIKTNSVALLVNHEKIRSIFHISIFLNVILYTSSLVFIIFLEYAILILTVNFSFKNNFIL